IPDLDVIRPLTLAERAVTVALGISLDYDLFSTHTG
ncbi:altered inheritance rate of mitochondria protein 25-like, partial [Trifolium medium]|nr:altered inheritance rate of mitochondria protein 25-like [Trifolium medium]